MPFWNGDFYQNNQVESTVEYQTNDDKQAKYQTKIKPITNNKHQTSLIGPQTGGTVMQTKALLVFGHVKAVSSQSEHDPSCCSTMRQLQKHLREQAMKDIIYLD